jgi:hypothetical protein
MQTQIISMAMAEATKMFDKTGGSGNKQEAVNGAAMTAMKLLVQSKLGGSPFGGGSNSGGLSGLASLVCIQHFVDRSCLNNYNSGGQVFVRPKFLCKIRCFGICGVFCLLLKEPTFFEVPKTRNTYIGNKNS